MSETLEQAAFEKIYTSNDNAFYNKGRKAYTKGHERGFIMGANWMKEQYKKLLSLAAMAASTLQDEGDTTTANEIIKEIERLQSI